MDFSKVDDNCLKLLYKEKDKVEKDAAYFITEEARRRQFSYNSKFNVLDSTHFSVLSTNMDLVFGANATHYNSLRNSTKNQSVIELFKKIKAIKMEQIIGLESEALLYYQYLGKLDIDNIKNPGIRYAMKEALAYLFSVESIKASMDSNEIIAFKKLPDKVYDLPQNELCLYFDFFDWLSDVDKATLIKYGLSKCHVTLLKKIPYETFEYCLKNTDVAVDMTSLLIDALESNPQADMQQFLEKVKDWFYSFDGLSDLAWEHLYGAMKLANPEAFLDDYLKDIVKMVDDVVAAGMESNYVLFSELAMMPVQENVYTKRKDTPFIKYNSCYTDGYSVYFSKQDYVGKVVMTSFATMLVDIYERIVRVAEFDYFGDFSLRDELKCKTTCNGAIMDAFKRLTEFLSGICIDSMVPSRRDKEYAHHSTYLCKDAAAIIAAVKALKGNVSAKEASSVVLNEINAWSGINNEAKYLLLDKTIDIADLNSLSNCRKILNEIAFLDKDSNDFQSNLYRRLVEKLGEIREDYKVIVQYFDEESKEKTKTIEFYKRLLSY